jgi:hypothetical protein
VGFADHDNCEKKKYIRTLSLAFKYVTDAPNSLQSCKSLVSQDDVLKK